MWTGNFPKIYRYDVKDTACGFFHYRPRVRATCISLRIGLNYAPQFISTFCGDNSVLLGFIDNESHRTISFDGKATSGAPNYQTFEPMHFRHELGNDEMLLIEFFRSPTLDVL